MTICPKCQSENRPGAKFCSKCGQLLPQNHSASSSLTRPLVTAPLNLPDIHSELPVQPNGSLPSSPKGERTNTRPLNISPSFTPRPIGAIFSERFLATNLVLSNEYNGYDIVQFGVSEDQLIRACPNPECGAIHSPGEYTEQFCTVCGTPLGMQLPDLILTEARSNLFTNSMSSIIACRLTHDSVRAPLEAFQETVAGVQRYCLVTPKVSELPGRPEPMQALRWGVGLARGLAYLHDNDISLGGQVNPACFGLVGDRAVWVNFMTSNAHPDMLDQARPADIYALALQLFQWMTGRSQPGEDPNLPPAVNKLFKQAFAPPGFVTGMELARGIEQALQESIVPLAVDHQVGRRTDVGRERTLNEDSLYVLDFTRIQQSISRPIGVYVVADGMGGHSAGEVASGTIVSTIAKKAGELSASLAISEAGQDLMQWLSYAVDAANQAVYDMRKSAGTDMGSTLVMAILDGNINYLAHVGDSRAYLINGQGIRQLTVDHSLVERLVATHQITREEARRHPQRNVIYRTIGDKPKVEADFSTNSLAVGDKLLLCSDGLSGMVEDEMIRKIVMEQSNSSQDACTKLIAAANQAGGTDNITAIVVEIT